MARMTFGEVLRDARERKGIDLAEAARRLRIRPDILRAIEDDDFSRMPPRGYTRNMVNAYARLVGLNPSEMTRMYLDEAYAFQVGRARSDAPQRGTDRGASARSGRSAARSQGRPSHEDEREPRRNALGRTMYDDRRDYSRDWGGRPGNTNRMHADDRTHPSRHTALPNAQYTNFYAGPKAAGAVQSKLPFIIAGAVILILLVVVLVLAFGGRGGGAADDAPKVPVTGLTDTTQGEGSSEGSNASGQSTEQPVVTETAPTSLSVEYKIAKDTAVYAVITLNGAAEEQMFSGGESQTVELKADDVWTLSAWASDAVTVTADGEKVAFDGTANDGSPQCTVDFNAYLEKWYEDHPNAKKPADASTGTDASASGSDTTAASNATTATGTSGTGGSATGTGTSTGTGTAA